jgi:predicted nucleotidyltransferase
MEEFDFKSAKKWLLDKQKRKEKIRRDLYKKAKKEFEEIVKMIIKKFKPKKIYQWGSLIHQENFREYSDIDIGIEGLKSIEEFFNLYGEAENISSFPLDIIELDKIEEKTANFIKKKAKFIYEDENKF